MYTEEALAEIRERLSTRDAYVNTEGGLYASPVVETVERVLKAITG